MRAIGGGAGLVFAVLAAVGFAIAPGPDSASGIAVVDYYAEHDTATLWQASLFGVAAVFLLWFVGILAGEVRRGGPDRPFPAGMVIGAGSATIALFLAGVACWEALAETFGNVTETTVVDPEAYGDAHMLWSLSQGLGKMTNFTAGAFVVAVAAGFLAAKRAPGWFHVLGVLLGIGLVADGPLQIGATSDWSDTVGDVAFVAFLVWIAAISLMLVLRPSTGRERASPHPAG